MRRIYKYELKITDEQIIPAPNTAFILDAQFQGNKLCIWVEFNPAHVIDVGIGIRIIGTGHTFDLTEDGLMYIATAQKDGLVWHIYRTP